MELITSARALEKGQEQSSFQEEGEVQSLHEPVNVLVCLILSAETRPFINKNAIISISSKADTCIPDEASPHLTLALLLSLQLLLLLYTDPDETPPQCPVLAIQHKLPVKVSVFSTF